MMDLIVQSLFTLNALLKLPNTLRWSQIIPCPKYLILKYHQRTIFIRTQMPSGIFLYLVPNLFLQSQMPGLFSVQDHLIAV